MERIAYFFDGFNNYHAIDEEECYHKYKWLDYYKLAEIFTKKSQHIASVTYFTSYCNWKSESKKRHQDYVSALRTRNVNIIFGKFKRKTRKCKLCGGISNNYYEEKQTDVNIALYILKGAFLDEYDTAVLSTADTDLIPVIKTLRSMPIFKRIGILFPIKRDSIELKNEADFIMRIKKKHLKGCQLPDEIIVGVKKINRPKEWIEV